MLKQLKQVNGFMVKHGFAEEPIDIAGNKVNFFALRFSLISQATSLNYGKSLIEDRVKLIHEEFQELVNAIGENDETEVQDALVDLLYVIMGFALLMPLPFRVEEAFEAVHQHNMQKPVNGKFKPKEKGNTKPNLISRPTTTNHGPECFLVHGFNVPYVEIKQPKVVLKYRQDFLPWMN